MKNGIETKRYYAILDWKDNNLEKFRRYYKDRKLSELTTYELKELYILWEQEIVQYLKP